jgi:LPXTG-motif cell wall-anchored protein
MESVLKAAALTVLFSMIGPVSSFAGPSPCAACGHAAPAPEMGASALGMLMAAGLAGYLIRRRKDKSPKS